MATELGCVTPEMKRTMARRDWTERGTGQIWGSLGIGRRRLIKNAPAGIGRGACLMATTRNTAWIRRAISAHVTEPAAGTWSNCLVADGVAYVAGMVARGSDGKVIAGDEYEQAKLIFNKIKITTKQSGNQRSLTGRQRRATLNRWPPTGQALTSAARPGTPNRVIRVIFRLQGCGPKIP